MKVVNYFIKIFICKIMVFHLSIFFFTFETLYSNCFCYFEGYLFLYL